MRLRGILDKAFDNFIALRGYAKMGDLDRISIADDSYQRDLITEHKQEMVDFLNSGEYLFFPEVILGAVLESDTGSVEKVNQLYQSFFKEESYKEEFEQFKIQYSITKSQNQILGSGFDLFRRTTIDISDKTIKKPEFRKFNRIDGNHRLSATCEDTKFGHYNVPFCLILFRNETEAKKFSRALFHNINYKHMPLTMEQNLKLILEDERLFSDDDLKNKSAFGWAYFFDRKLAGKMDLALIPNIRKSFEKSERTFLLYLFKLLLEEKLIQESNESLNVIKSVFTAVNTLYCHEQLQKCSNSRILEAFIYYQLKAKSYIRPFKNWIIENHIYAIEESEILNGHTINEFVAVFNKIMESRKRTIFISMQFSEETKQNFEAIKNAVDDVNRNHKLELKLREIRIDFFNKGYSYKITDEILVLVEGCGLLIADLSMGNKNVYHEIGYLMGLNQGNQREHNNFILIHNSGINGCTFDKDVGFNIRDFKVLKENNTNDLRNHLRDQIEKYYGF